MILPAEFAGGALFHPGTIYVTRIAQVFLTCEDIDTSLLRHLRGDWGELEAEDREANDRALRDGSRLFSLYRSAAKMRFYIITEASRECTTILMPSEY